MCVSPLIFSSFHHQWCLNNPSLPKLGLRAVCCSCHYNDVIMTTIASQITSLAVVYSTLYSDADQRKHQSSASLAFVWGIHRDRWIPRTKGELRGKCFHLMTSSCVITNCGEHPHIPSHPFFFLNSSSRLLEENITRKHYLYAWSCLSFFFSFLSLLFLLIFWSGWISIAVCGPISARGGSWVWDKV